MMDHLEVKTYHYNKDFSPRAKSWSSFSEKSDSDPHSKFREVQIVSILVRKSYFSSEIVCTVHNHIQIHQIPDKIWHLLANSGDFDGFIFFIPQEKCRRKFLYKMEQFILTCLKINDKMPWA